LIALILVAVAGTALAQDVQYVQYVEKAPEGCTLLETDKFEGGLKPSLIRKRMQIGHARKIGATHIERLTTLLGVGQQCIPTTVAVEGGLAPGAAMCQSSGLYLVELRYLVCPTAD
jgi:hypothetical protein